MEFGNFLEIGIGLMVCGSGCVGGCVGSAAGVCEATRAASSFCFFANGSDRPAISLIRIEIDFTYLYQFLIFRGGILEILKISQKKTFFFDFFLNIVIFLQFS